MVLWQLGVADEVRRMATFIRLLVAEDNPGDLYLIKEALRQVRFDCEMHVLSDGAEALRYIDQFDSNEHLPCPDLFLLDLHLPKHDGAEILGRLRSSVRCAELPVIVMSSSDSPSDHGSASRFGAIEYFRKPRDLSQFMKLGTIVKSFFAQ
jgi:CheY-like chemotaxis protein